MIEKITRAYVGKLVEHGVISNNDADVYMYGFYQTVMFLVNIITTTFIAVLFHQFIPCLLLNLFYIPIRMCAGGYHASTPLRCYVISVCMIIGLLFVIRWINFSYITSWMIIMFSCIGIIIMSPVETTNNPLDNDEVLVYKKRTYIVLTFEIIMSLLFTYLLYDQFLEIVSLALITELGMLLIGKLCLQNK